MLKTKPFCDLGFAKVDIDRYKRRGFPEVIYAKGKTKEQIKSISRQIIKNKQDLLLTKLDENIFKYLKKTFPSLKYNVLAKIAYIAVKPKTAKGMAVIISAGTSDIPVAEEAAVTLEVMGNRTLKIYDVGVAGVHRFIHNVEVLRKANVIIVAAGMDAALASLVSGVVSCPVIAVPTSSGYGASFGGVAALLAMLNSCSPGVTVVNIDNGFGAGYFASLINR